MARTSYRSRPAHAMVTMLLAFCGLCINAAPLHADETDQFTLPIDQEFADIGEFLSLKHYRVLERVVNRTNSDIAAALRLSQEGRREQVLDRLHSPGTIADRVRHEFGPGFMEMRILEEFLYSDKMQDQFPGKLTAYRTPFWIFFYTHLPIDPRKLVMLFQASTIRAYGVHFGTDKIGHFHDLGHFYYKDLLRFRAGDMSDEEATARIVREYSRGLLSEGALIGLWATGVLSNADLAANYSGFKFYKNLTEPIPWQHETLPPILIRIGHFWAMNTHVRPDADIIKPFITDHWNEALNPSLYEWGMRGPIESRLRDMASDIRAFYCELDGRPCTPEYFDELVVELSTYFGEDYGHSGVDDRLITIGSTCFDVDDDENGDGDENAPASVSAPGPGEAEFVIKGD